MASHPTWVRGLKRMKQSSPCEPFLVAPYVGAWIETDPKESYQTNVWSHPTWVRGLKR